MNLNHLHLHVVPRWLYDRVFERAPRKPRAVVE